MNLADLTASSAQRAHGKFIARDFTCRALSGFSVKAGASAAIGATTITLGTLPVGLAGVIGGDQLVMGAQTRTVAADALAVTGSISAPITAALTAAVTSASAITITRKTDAACSGWLEQLDVTSVVGLVTAGDAAITILANTLSATPRVGDQIIADGKAWVIKSVARDPSGCAWVLQCSGGNG